MLLKQPKRVRATETIDLNELREEIIKHKEEGIKIIAHFKKMEEYYNDWQDRLYALEKKITEAEEQHGITQEQVEEYDALADIPAIQ